MSRLPHPAGRRQPTLPPRERPAASRGLVGARSETAEADDPPPPPRRASCRGPPPTGSASRGCHQPIRRVGYSPMHTRRWSHSPPCGRSVWEGSRRQSRDPFVWTTTPHDGGGGGGGGGRRGLGIHQPSRLWRTHRRVSGPRDPVDTVGQTEKMYIFGPKRPARRLVRPATVLGAVSWGAPATETPVSATGVCDVQRRGGAERRYGALWRPTVQRPLVLVCLFFLRGERVVADACNPERSPACVHRLCALA